MTNSGEHCQVVIACLDMSVKILESFGTNQLIQFKKGLSTEKNTRLLFQPLMITTTTMMMMLMMIKLMIKSTLTAVAAETNKSDNFLFTI